MFHFGVSCLAAIIVALSMFISTASSDEKPLGDPIKRTMSARLICRLGPHRIKLGDKCKLSETLECKGDAVAKGVYYHVYRVGFFHRQLGRMVMTESGHDVNKRLFDGLADQDLWGATPRASDGSERPQRTTEFLPKLPGVYTVNVIWTIKREPKNQEGWLERVESKPVLLQVDPPKDWTIKRINNDEYANKDLFSFDLNKEQALLESKYKDGELPP